MKMTIYAYFRKFIKSTPVMLRLKLPRVLKFTLAGREFHTLMELKLKILRCGKVLASGANKIR